VVPQWFIYLNGFAMLILGVALIATRPHRPGDSFYKRFVNFGTLWALLCLSMGLALLSLALGYWSLSGHHAPRAGTGRTHWENRP
jgi:hypothetical protein